jgi:quercetin dioxygenase-like cupin family protein
MGKVTFTGSDDNVLNPEYSTARGPVMRSDKQEISVVFFPGGTGAEAHRHPEEQTFYVVSGRIRVTVGEGDDAETYEVAPGEGSFHPSNALHRVEALEDTRCVSFKNVVDPTQYAETGRLDA